MEYIRIPVIQDMKNDLDECTRMEDNGEEKDCSGCSLNGGDYIGCLTDYGWYREEGEAER